jgi:DNA-binding winged helix-turn-helix (wHTH) protein
MPPVAYRFGRFVFDVDTRQLQLDSTEIHLSPKAFELLAALIRHRARAVSKRELQETLWPSTFVEETNLASLVAEIRRAIGDSATEPAFVRTVHRFGYRFVGEILETQVTPAVPVRTRPCLIVENRKAILLEGVNVIGRAPDAAIRCDAPGVSRHHARIVVSNDGALLEDLGSKNGTYVGRERVTSASLADGDEIRIGNARLIFRIQPPLEPTETVVMDPEEL